MSLEVVPMTLKEANAYVEQHHRHHGPVVGHKFSITNNLGGRTEYAADVELEEDGIAAYRNKPEEE